MIHIQDISCTRISFNDTLLSPEEIQEKLSQIISETLNTMISQDLGLQGKEIRDCHRAYLGWNLYIAQHLATEFPQEIPTAPLPNQENICHRIQIESLINRDLFNILVCLVNSTSPDEKKDILFSRITNLFQLLTLYIDGLQQAKQCAASDYPIYLLYLLLSQQEALASQAIPDRVNFCYQQVKTILIPFFPQLPPQLDAQTWSLLAGDPRFSPPRNTLFFGIIRDLLSKNVLDISPIYLQHLAKQQQEATLPILEDHYVLFDFMLPQLQEADRLFPWICRTPSLCQYILQISQTLPTLTKTLSVFTLYETIVPMVHALWEQVTPELSFLEVNKIASVLNTLAQTVREIVSNAYAKNELVQVSTHTLKPIAYLEDILQCALFFLSENSNGTVYQNLDLVISHSRLAGFIRRFNLPNTISWYSSQNQKLVSQKPPVPFIDKSYLDPLEKNESVRLQIFDSTTKISFVWLKKMFQQMHDSISLLASLQSNTGPESLSTLYADLMVQYRELMFFDKAENTLLLCNMHQEFVSTLSNLERFYIDCFKQSWDNDTKTLDLFHLNCLQPRLLVTLYDTFHKNFNIDALTAAKSIHTIIVKSKQHGVQPASSVLEAPEPLGDLPNLDPVLSWPFDKRPLNQSLESLAFALSKAGHSPLAFWAYTRFLVQGSAKTYTEQVQRIWRWVFFAKLANLIPSENPTPISPFFWLFYRNNQTVLSQLPKPIPKILEILSKNPLDALSKTIQSEVTTAFYGVFYEYVQTHIPDNISGSERMAVLSNLFNTYSLSQLGFVDPNPKKSISIPPVLTVDYEAELVCLDRDLAACQKQCDSLNLTASKAKLKELQEQERALLAEREKMISQYTRQLSVLQKQLTEEQAKKIRLEEALTLKSQSPVLLSSSNVNLSTKVLDKKSAKGKKVTLP